MQTSVAKRSEVRDFQEEAKQREDGWVLAESVWEEQEEEGVGGGGGGRGGGAE